MKCTWRAVIVLAGSQPPRRPLSSRISITSRPRFARECQRRRFRRVLLGQSERHISGTCEVNRAECPDTRGFSEWRDIGPRFYIVLANKVGEAAQELLHLLDRGFS